MNDILTKNLKYNYSMFLQNFIRITCLKLQPQSGYFMNDPRIYSLSLQLHTEFPQAPE